MDKLARDDDTARGGQDHVYNSAQMTGPTSMGTATPRDGGRGTSWAHIPLAYDKFRF